jgi:beta-aspartyl-dipeptidase (metallo-type)
MTFTSDGYGSFSTYDAEGNLERIGIASLSAVFNELKHMVRDDYLTLEQSLPYMTTNVAAGLNLGNRKGRLEAGYDADLLLLDEDLEISTFISRGIVLKEDGNIVARFPFEKKREETDDE